MLFCQPWREDVLSVSEICCPVIPGKVMSCPVSQVEVLSSQSRKVLSCLSGRGVSCQSRGGVVMSVTEMCCLICQGEVLSCQSGRRAVLAAIRTAVLSAGIIAVLSGREAVLFPVKER